MSSELSRLIEKDIMAAIIPANNGSSTTVDLSGALKFSAQAVYDVQAPSAKTFDSGVASTLVNQSITYTADVRGVAGDSITMTLVDPGEDSALDIEVTGTDIVVTLAYDEAVAATLTNQGVTYTAVTAGAAGNSITVALLDPGMDGALSINVTGSDIEVTLAYATGAVTTTAAQLVAALLLDAGVTALVTPSGAGATPLNALAETPLANGADATVTTDADALVAAINLDVDAAALITASGTGSSALAALAETPLAGGVNSEVDVADNELAIPTHSFLLGTKIRLTTTGTLPAGLALATDYFVIPVDASTIQLASSLANAIAGTEIDITDQGSSGAVNTVTAVALSGASVTFQKSNDGTNWVDIAAATAITVDGSTMIENTAVCYRYFKAVKALTAGVVDLEVNVLVIGASVGA